MNRLGQNILRFALVLICFQAHTLRAQIDGYTRLFVEAEAYFETMSSAEKVYELATQFKNGQHEGFAPQSLSTIFMHTMVMSEP